MKILIDIPDDFIKDCDGNLDCVISLIGYEIDDVYSEEMGYTGFNKYTILPKGHGRLGDLSRLYVELNEAQIEGTEEYRGLGKAKQIVCDATTIIPSDER